VLKSARVMIGLSVAVVLLLALTLQAAPTSPSGAPQRGGTLIVVLEEIPDIVDPSVSWNTIFNRIVRNTHDSLVYMVDPNTFAPWLAERWEISSDYKSFTFYLRRDVRFHDGTPMTAEAVKTTWERPLNPANRSPAIQLFGQDTKIEVLGTHTVRISFSEPHPRFLQSMALPQLGPGSPAAMQRLGSAYLKTPVGTGPFKIEGWPNETTLVLVRNPDYRWPPGHAQNKGPAYLDRIIVRFVAETAPRSLALERGEVHVVDEPARQSASRYRNDPRLKIRSFAVPGLPQYWAFNTTVWPSYELAVRRAAQHAIDRQRIARIALFDTVPVAYGPLTQSNWAFWPEAKNYYPYDPKKSVEILEGAGFKKNASTGLYEKEGKPIRLRLVTSTRDDQIRPGTMAQAMLREVGMEMVVEGLSSGAGFARYRANDYELARHGLNTVDPDGLSFAFHSRQINTPAVSNRGRINFKALDILLERGRALVNPEERRRVYWQVQKTLLDMANAIYTTEVTYFTVTQSCVEGFKWDVQGFTEYHETWLSGDCRRIGQ
jgi:peptide/nickel transport system substrate-binding protein